MSFQTSQYSSLTQSDYGDAQTDWVDVQDYAGYKFRVYSDGTVELTSTGKTWTPSDGLLYSEILFNLGNYPGNEAKMASVMDRVVLDKALNEGAQSLPTTGGGSAPRAVPQTESLTPSIFEQWWYYPAFLLGSSALIGGGAYLYFTRTQKGMAQWKKFRKR